jgi:hypothetical protein
MQSYVIGWPDFESKKDETHSHVVGDTGTVSYGSNQLQHAVFFEQLIVDELVNKLHIFMEPKN